MTIYGFSEFIYEYTGSENKILDTLIDAVFLSTISLPPNSFEIPLQKLFNKKRVHFHRPWTQHPS